MPPSDTDMADAAGVGIAPGDNPDPAVIQAALAKANQEVQACLTVAGLPATQFLTWEKAYENVEFASVFQLLLVDRDLDPGTVQGTMNPMQFFALFGGLAASISLAIQACHRKIASSIKSPVSASKPQTQRLPNLNGIPLYTGKTGSKAELWMKDWQLFCESNGLDACKMLVLRMAHEKPSHARSYGPKRGHRHSQRVPSQRVYPGKRD